jgi:hypothetical protein
MKIMAALYMACNVALFVQEPFLHLLQRVTYFDLHTLGLIK